MKTSLKTKLIVIGLLLFTLMTLLLVKIIDFQWVLDNIILITGWALAIYNWLISEDKAADNKVLTESLIDASAKIGSQDELLKSYRESIMTKAKLLEASKEIYKRDTGKQMHDADINNMAVKTVTTQYYHSSAIPPTSTRDTNTGTLRG